MTSIDINAWRDMSFVRIVPETERGETWCAEHINAEPYAGAYMAEHRYGPDILSAAHNAGLTVALDGDIADAPRVFQPCGFCPEGRVCATLGGCWMMSEHERDGFA